MHATLLSDVPAPRQKIPAVNAVLRVAFTNPPPVVLLLCCVGQSHPLWQVSTPLCNANPRLSSRRNSPQGSPRAISGGTQHLSPTHFRPATSAPFPKPATVDDTIRANPLMRLGVTRLYTDQETQRPLYAGCLCERSRARDVVGLWGGLDDRGTAGAAEGGGLVATDLDWSRGSGPEVRGRAMALLLLVANRRQVLPYLEGSGLAGYKPTAGPFPAYGGTLEDRSVTAHVSAGSYSYG